MNRLMDHLAHGYWNDVQKRLIEKHGLSAPNAIAAISDFRSRLAKHDVGEIIYHEDAWRIAESIAAAVKKGGFVEPNGETAKNGKKTTKREKRS